MLNTPRYARSPFFLSLLFSLVAGAALAGGQAAPSQAPGGQAPAAPAKGAIAGVRNFTRVDSTIACGCAVTPDAWGDIKAAGFASVVNLRAATEQGVDIEADRKAAEAVGLKYHHLPFVTASPDLTKFDEFLKLFAAPENQPMLLHCASGGRASFFWAVKRVMIDGWPVEKAMGELPGLSGNASPALRTAALDYLKSKGKARP